jgi:excisionase family DNA binding protein
MSAIPQSLDAAPVITPRLMTVRQLAAWLALSERTIKRMVAAQEIPGIVRIGRSVRFDRNQVETWVSRGCPRLRSVVKRTDKQSKNAKARRSTGRLA